MTTMLNYFTIEGIASTDSLDSYDEVINQEGLDLSLVDENLVTINIEHGEDFPLFEMAVIGLVTEAKLKDEGLWIKGKIYFDHQYSDNIYQELSNGHGYQRHLIILSLLALRMIFARSKNPFAISTIDYSKRKPSLLS